MNQILLVAVIVLAAFAAIACVAAMGRGVGKPRLHSLPDESKDRYARSWRGIQARFIDDPRSAVKEADKTTVMMLSEQGANVTDEAHMPAELREAREVTRGNSDTEGMRQAMVHYQRMVDDAVGADRVATEAGQREMA